MAHMEKLILMYILAYVFAWALLIGLTRAGTLRYSFKWFDLWVGLFVDLKKHRLYILPLPCCVFCWQYKPYYYDAGLRCHWLPGGTECGCVGARGCHGTFTECRDTYHNEERFGGFPGVCK